MCNAQHQNERRRLLCRGRNQLAAWAIASSICFHSGVIDVGPALKIAGRYSRQQRSMSCDCGSLLSPSSFDASSCRRGRVLACSLSHSALSTASEPRSHSTWCQISCNSPVGPLPKPPPPNEGRPNCHSATPTSIAAAPIPAYFQLMFNPPEPQD